MRKLLFMTAGLVCLMIGVLANACKKEDAIICTTPVTYTNTMKAIIDSKCTSCHRAGGSSANQGIYTSYSALQARTNAMFEETVNRKTMPPTGPLSQTDLDAWKCWRENGFKE